ncbi:MAG: hypothetical protein E6Q58_02250 [Niabella sp.]|nr:MAG: hypothetical protein E6Q58_02250 [Niabella sp.]
MNPSHIKAHKLAWDRSTIEDELKFLEERLQRLPEKVSKVKDNLGVGFDTATSILGLRIAINRSNNEIIEALQNIVEWGVALFQRAMTHRDEMVELFVSNQKVYATGHSSYYNSAPRWQHAFGAALALRNENAVKSLCAFDVSLWGGTCDLYHYTYVDAVIAFMTKSGDWNQLLHESETKAINATLYPKLAHQLGLPRIALTHAILHNKQEAYCLALTPALSNYFKCYSKKPDNRDPVGVLSLIYLGWCAFAHDRSLECNLKSDYIPEWIVKGNFH